MSADRFARRRRAGKWQEVRGYVAAAMVVIALIFVVWLVGWSSALSVRSVDVSGQSSLKVERIRTVAQVPKGVSLARSDTDAIAKRVSALKRVASVDVSRDWPHTISIEVVERTAVAWVSSGGKKQAVDRHGVRFRSYRRTPKNLVEMRIGTVSTDMQARLIKEAAAVLDSIRRGDAGLYRQIQHVEAESIDSVTLDLTRGRVVRWGNANEAKAKLTVLKPLLKIKASSYDVSAPEQPTTKR